MMQKLQGKCSILRVEAPWGEERGFWEAPPLPLPTEKTEAS